MEKKKKIIKILISLLFIFLPIIDMVRRTQIKNIDIFGFSIIEFVYIFIIGITIILTLLNMLNKKKEILPLVIYTIFLLIYIFFHCHNILKFDNSILPDSEINIITEAYYILRIYYMPVLLLFILVKNKDIFDLKYYLWIAKILICIISGLIVFLNIFKISYASYAATNSEFVKYNIFDFYKSNESAKLLSTRGLFDSANEISAILIMLLPLNIYMLYRDKKKHNLFIYVLQFLAMIILGTRISALGAIIVSFVAIVINLFYNFKDNININYKMIIFAIICSLYFFISPIGVYMLNEGITLYSSDDKYSEELKQISVSKESAAYIKTHLYEFRINEEFAEIYPIEDDIYFWHQMALRDRNLNNNSRIMKTSILKRVKERNNNKLDTLLGIGYTTYFIDLERDYVYQYYLFGLLGIIMILPQLLLLLKAIYICLKNIKHLTYDYVLIGMMSVLGFITAYLSGHVFGWVSPSYILVFSLSLLSFKINNLDVGDKSEKG